MAAQPGSAPAGGRPKRRTYYIKKDFQRRFILRFCLVGLAAMGAASAVLYFMSRGTVTATYRYHRLALEQTADAIAPALLVTNLAVLVALVIATVYVTLYVSHKIAGPLFRFEQDLSFIGEGNLQKRIRLRDGDQLSEFAQAINGMTEGLHGRMKTLQDQMAALKDKADKGEVSPEAIKEDLAKLDSEMRTLFKTEWD